LASRDVPNVKIGDLRSQEALSDQVAFRLYAEQPISPTQPQPTEISRMRCKIERRLPDDMRGQSVAAALSKVG
jgi:hypothetical protein